jgi:hypothetical protein
MLPGMTSDDITPEMCEQMMQSIGPGLKYLTELWDRTCKVGMSKDEKIGQPIYRAYSAMHGLWVTLHYHACDQNRKTNPLPNVWGQNNKKL